MDGLDPNGIQQVVKLLQDSCVPDTNVQHAVTAKLDELNQHPDFNKYLTFVFVSATEDEMLRKTAGLLLKNNINLNFSSMTPAVQQYIKSGLLSILNSPQSDIRRTVANNINTIAVGSRKNPGSGLANWAELVGILRQGLQSQDQNMVSGCFEVLELLCDDLTEALDRNIQGTRATDVLIPQLVQMITVEATTIQAHCLSCIAHFIPLMPTALSNSMEQYLRGVFALVQSPDHNVRKHVCHTFVLLIELRTDTMLFQSGSVSHVVEYMLSATMDGNEDVALEACEFWTAICRRQELTVTADLLRGFVDRIVRVLLARMVYSHDELELMNANGDDDDYDQQDSDQDIRPTTHKARHMDNTNDDDDDYYGEEDDPDPAGWNIRKCAASGLDNLAIVFGDALWPHLQPLLENSFNSANWLEREAAVLALGAIADGCLEGLKPHLARLLEFLCLLLKDTQPLIRSISCWTLSRFSAWLVEQNDPERFIRPILVELVARIADTNKNVQRVACSALATLEDEAQQQLVAYLDILIPPLVSAFANYQAKNMLILYDAVGTLADAVGMELNQPQYVTALLTPLMTHLNTLNPTDKQLLPLLECVTDVAQALGPAFMPYAQATYNRACQIIQQVLTEHSQAFPDPNVTPPPLEPVIWSLDLISGLCVGLKQHMGQIVGAGQTSLMNVILHCLQERCGLEHTRQSALALLGDLAKACIDQVQPHVGALVPFIAANLSPYFVSVCNNASWALGEIAVRVPPEVLAPHVDQLAVKLADIVLNPHQDFHPSLLENCAITIGRLGMVVPASVAQNLGSFLPVWCRQIAVIHDPTEKTHAYSGLVSMVLANPNAAVPHFAFVCDCIAQCNLPDQELHDRFHSLLNGFKTSVGEQQWNSFFAQFPESTRSVLQTRYRV